MPKIGWKRTFTHMQWEAHKEKEKEIEKVHWERERKAHIHPRTQHTEQIHKKKTTLANSRFACRFLYLYLFYELAGLLNSSLCAFYLCCLLQRWRRRWRWRRQMLLLLILLAYCQKANIHREQQAAYYNYIKRTNSFFYSYIPSYTNRANFNVKIHQKHFLLAKLK